MKCFGNLLLSCDQMEQRCELLCCITVVVAEHVVPIHHLETLKSEHKFTHQSVVQKKSRT